jgi:alcohol dehydrogenase class IV
VPTLPVLSLGLTDEARDVKFPLVGEHLLPTLSVIDPEQCASMPKSITADNVHNHIPKS